MVVCRQKQPLPNCPVAQHKSLLVLFKRSLYTPAVCIARERQLSQYTTVPYCLVNARTLPPHAYADQHS
jgi:hypothetical protein